MISRTRGRAVSTKVVVIALVLVLAVLGLYIFLSNRGPVLSKGVQPHTGASKNGATGTPGTPGTPSSTSGGNWWRTSGTKILDASGQTVFLRGADDGQMATQGWTSSSVPNVAEMKNLSAWRFSFLRLAISWANLEPTIPTGSPSALTHTWNQTYLSELDGVVKLAQQNNIRIVLDMHQAGGWSPKFGGEGLPGWLYPQQVSCTAQAACTNTNAGPCEFLTNTAEAGVPIQPQQGLIAAWKMVTSRYQSDATVVGVDLFNEPQSCTKAGQPRTYHLPTASDNPLDAFYRLAGLAVQSVNPHLLLIYEDDAYESYLRVGSALTGRLDLPNAVYSTHYYPDSWGQGNLPGSCKPLPSPSGQATMMAYQQRAAQFDQPLYIGEFDGFRLTREGKKCRLLQSVSGASNDLLSLMTYAKDNAISWSLWRYDGGQSMVDSAGKARQPLIGDLQTGL